jgi:hypothetical protein
MDDFLCKRGCLGSLFYFLYVEARSFDKGYRQRKKK